MKELLNVVFTIDENFVQHFSVTLISLLENNKDISIEVFVIHNIKNLNSLNKVINHVYNIYKTKINLVKVDDNIFVKYKISNHVSSATYFRLLLADILPKSINKILYLDSDTIITGSLKGLLLLNFVNNSLFAVKDGDFINSILRLNEIGIPTKDYFNAGVMYINLEVWRLETISLQLIKIANEYMDKITWWDQDILNICFYGKWNQMDDNYNKMRLIEKQREIPLIIHFNTHTKPWHYLNYHPYKYLYWKYLKLTPFKNFKFDDFTYKRLVKKILYKIINKKYNV